MAERLGEIGRVLSSISDAVKTVKSLQQKNGQLYRIIEETKEKAVELDRLQIPEEPLLLKLKDTVKKVRDSGAQLEALIRKFNTEADTFDRSVRAKIKRNTLPSETMGEFCKDLNDMHRVASDFSKAFDSFCEHLSRAQELATELTTKLNEKGLETEKKADSARNKGTAGTVTLVAAGVGLVALGFFTGGAAWVAAGAVAGAACGVGAGVVGAATYKNVKQLRQLASGILSDAGKLGDIAKELRSSSEKAGEIKLDKEAIEALETALEFYKRDMDRDEMLAERDAKIAQLEAQLRSLGQ